MSLPEPVMWTLNRLDSVQRARYTGSPHSPNPHHLEALEDAGYITVRAVRGGGWHVYVLDEGQKAALADRRTRAQHFQFQQKANA